MQSSLNIVAGYNVLIESSREDVRPRLEEIRKIGWLGPQWKDTTIDTIRVAKRYWRK